MYRRQGRLALPVGEVEDVSVVLDKAVVAEVVLRIGGRTVPDIP